MIPPTVGRVVWFWLEGEASRDREEQPFAALVTYVHSDTMVNLITFDDQGQPHPRTSVPLYDGQGAPPQGMYCEWMPYQKGQAAKTEKLEKQLAQKKA
jgi:hypothetical protein